MTETLDIPVAAPPHDTDLLLHLYEKEPVTPGSRALCGHIKRSLSNADGVKCYVCMELHYETLGRMDAEMRLEIAALKREAERMSLIARLVDHD